MIKTLKNFLLQDLGLKLWSLLLALIFWYAIQDQREVESFIQADVQLKNRPSDLIITNTVIDRVVLRVRGSQTQIKKLQANKLPAYEIDLANTNSGRALFRVFPFDFKLPASVRITRINPQLITVELEEQRSKRLPVRANFKGRLERGFSILETKITPPNVVVAGAASVIDLIKEIPTASIDMTGAREDFDGTFPLLLNSDNLWLDGDSLVKVEITIQERTISGIVENAPITVRGNFSEATTDPKEAAMVVRGPAGKVNDLLKLPPTLYVDGRKVSFAKSASRKLRLKLRHDLDNDLKVIKLMPDLVQVSLTK